MKRLLNLLRFWWKPTSTNAHIVAVCAIWEMEENEVYSVRNLIHAIRKEGCWKEGSRHA
jgi:hypothetical protein